jgi:hypothetical protein
MKMMKNLVLTGLFLLFISPLITSEMYLWNSVIVDEPNSVVKHHAFYWFDDTSARGIGKQKDIPIILWYEVEPLPYDLASRGYWGEVDWCNLTIKSYHNIYGTTFVAFQGFSGGDLLNTTTEVQTYYFTNTSLSYGQIVLNMRDKDSFVADMICHYTDNRSLYVENALIGRFTTYTPSFECEGCSKYSLEELSNQVEKQDEITANELEIYTAFQSMINWNFQIWLVMSYVVKIGFVFVAIGLIFATGYYFYMFLKKIGDEM